VGVAVALAVAAAVGVATAVGVAAAVAVAEAVGFAVAVLLFVGVATGFAVPPFAAGVAAGVVGPPPRAIPPAKPTVPTELLSAGGVIERTAPKPVTVPTAIKIAFFIPVLSLFYLRVL
jgi:hypothetical protein